MAYEGLTVEYMVKTSGDRWFISGNCQGPTNSHDNPDNGTKTEQLAQCFLLSPDGEEAVAS